MQIEIIEGSIQFCLHGRSSAVENHSFGEVGLRLMNEMWRVVRDVDLDTTGINHWVYLPDGWMDGCL